MLTAQAEGLTERLEELKPHFPAHYDALSLHKGRHLLDPQYGTYLERDRRGEAVLVTLRRDGALVGYFVGFVAPGLHYRTCLTLTLDIFWIAPAHRGGTGALRLFRAVEREARRRGVHLWFQGSKLHQDSGRLFRALGFQAVETYYAKWLDADGNGGAAGEEHRGAGPGDGMDGGTREG